MILYYIRVLGNPNFIEIKNAYSTAKAKGERAYARLNKHKQPTDYFYVGSSADIRIRKRLREHLGYGNKKTYSLQLAHWAHGLEPELKLEFVCAKYPESLARDAYQALEDTLWEQLKPMFGREGKR